MMNTTAVYARAASAQAAYANLKEGQTGNTLVQALREGAGGFTLTQAKRFAAGQSVVLQYNDDAPGVGVNGTSLSVTVLKSSTNELTLAIRGTAEAGDFNPTDLLIAAQGAAYDQIVALYNWWMRVGTTAGANVPQFAWVELTDPRPNEVTLLRSKLVRLPDATATGELVSQLAADADHKFDVVGHSLGGSPGHGVRRLCVCGDGERDDIQRTGLLSGAVQRGVLVCAGHGHAERCRDGERDRLVCGAN